MKKKNKNFNKIMASTITASVVASTLVTVAPNASAADIKFKDVQSNAYFYEAINSLHARNIISGYEDGTFRPNETISRAHAAKIIALALDLDTTNIKDPGFIDVSKENTCYKYIAALANKGIVEGSNGEYKPNNPITRAQMAKIISLAYSLKLVDSQQLTFADVKQDDWFHNYVGALIEHQVTTGTTPTTFSPNKNVTRGQMAAFVYRSENIITPVQINETISNITNETLVTSEETYILSDEQKKWINPSNLAALKGAILKLTSKENKIEKIQSIELTAEGTPSTAIASPYENHVEFDGKGATIDSNVIVNGDYITVKNTTIKGDLHVGKGVKNSFFSEFIKVEGKTTIDDSLLVASQTKSYKSFTAKVASTNNFPVALNEITAKGRVVFSEFQLGDVGIDKNADVIFLSKTFGTSKVGEIVANSNVTLTAESSVVLPKVVIAQAATDVVINSNIASLQVTTTGDVKLTGKSDIVNLTLMTKASVNLQTMGRVSNLEINNKETTVTIGTVTKIGNLVIPTGLKPADIIGNYNSIKVNVEQVGGKKNPDLSDSSSGNSGNESIDTTPPAAVSGVIGVSTDINTETVGGLQNIISWTASTASDLSYYEVFRSTNSNGTTGAIKVGSNIAKGVATFTDTSVIGGATYYYTVFALDTSGNRSASSNVVMVATVNDSFALAPAPTGLQGVSPTMAGNDGKITGLDASKAYQYKLITDTNWTNAPLLTTEITGLGAGNYEVRFAAIGNLPASLPSTVSVPNLTQSQAPLFIQLINYKTTGDDMIFIPAPVGSTIKVYDASTNGNVIGSFSETEDLTKPPLVLIPGGFSEGLDKVYVTITENGKSESLRVEKGVPTTFPDAPNLSDISVTKNTFGEFKVTVKVPLPTNEYMISLYDASTGNPLTVLYIPDENGEKSVVIPNSFANGLSDINVAIVKVTDNGTQYAESLRTRVTLETLGTLTVNAEDDSLSNDKTSITVVETPDLGSEFVYKVFDDAMAANAGKPTINADVSSWETLPLHGKILAADGKSIVVVERDQAGRAKKVGQVAAVTMVNNKLLEAVMIDGKDGVSSQDGKVETIRLKFSANIDPTTVNNNSFTVNDFDIESIKVTDKNGRTPLLSDGTTPNLLYTQGENQYITIRVTPKDGTHFTPVVIQNPNESIVDVNGVNITGVNVTAVDQAAPVIISSTFFDNGSSGLDAGDQLTITFSEYVYLNSGNLVDLVNDFALSNQTNANFTFASDDNFALTGNTVTVTLGSTTVSKMEQNTTITMSANGSDISLIDDAFNKAKPQKEFVDETVYSIAKTIDINNIPLPIVDAIAALNATKAQ